MSTATRSTADARGATPARWALVAGLRRLRRSQIPRSRGAREVQVRLRADQQARMVHGGGADG